MNRNGHYLLLRGFILLNGLWLASCEDNSANDPHPLEKSSSQITQFGLSSLRVNGQEIITSPDIYISEFSLDVSLDISQTLLTAIYPSDAVMTVNGVESSGIEKLDLQQGLNKYQIQIKNAMEMRGYQLKVIRGAMGNSG